MTAPASMPATTGWKHCSAAARLDVVYFHNDEMAIGGWPYARAWASGAGRLGIAGWGGMEAASILPRRLTTTVVPTTAIGKAAAEALVARLKGEPGQDVTVVPTRLEPGRRADPLRPLHALTVQDDRIDAGCRGDEQPVLGPAAEAEVRDGSGTRILPIRCPSGAMQCNPSAAEDHRLPSYQPGCHRRSRE
jgi:hypothetical protein